MNSNRLLEANETLAGLVAHLETQTCHLWHGGDSNVGRDHLLGVVASLAGDQGRIEARHGVGGRESRAKTVPAEAIRPETS